MTEARTRRTAVGAVAAGVAALATGALGLDDAAAACAKIDEKCLKKTRKGKKKRKCCGGAKCKGGRCRCPRGERDCNGKCLSKKTCCTNRDCGSGKRCNRFGECVNNCVPSTCGDNAACTCCGASAVCKDSVCQPQAFSQTFASSLAGWVTRKNFEAGGGGRIGPPSESMSLVGDGARIRPGNFYENGRVASSQLGGWSRVWPSGGFDISLEMWIDVAETTPLARIEFNGYVNGTNCRSQLFEVDPDNPGYYAHYALHVGVNAAGTAVCVAQFDSSIGQPWDVCAFDGHVNLTMGTWRSGWYRFRTEYRRNGQDQLTIKLSVVEDSSGRVVLTKLVTPPRQLAPSRYGGNGGCDILINTFPDGVRIRNSRRENHLG